jgi:hypothetical protein
MSEECTRLVAVFAGDMPYRGMDQDVNRSNLLRDGRNALLNVVRIGEVQVPRNNCVYVFVG